MSFARVSLAAAAAFASATPAFGKIFFHEKFDNMDNWVQSEFSSVYGKFIIEDGGLVANESDKHYALSAPIGGTTGIHNEEKTFVISFTYQHKDHHKNCDGGYIKLMGNVEDPKKINDEATYQIMFGPDRCDGRNKVQLILGNYPLEIEWAHEVAFPQDPVTHAYTLAIFPDDTYKVFVDKKLKKKGSLKPDFPKMLEKIWIPNPDDKKPADWVDAAYIDDPEDEKPEDWDERKYIKMPGNPSPPWNWDEEKDGKWEVPEIPNIKYRGKWKPKQIPNPAYKGEWKPTHIRNEKFDPTKPVHIFGEPLRFICIDVFQMRKGGRFDNIVIGDDVAEVAALVDEGWQEVHAQEQEAWEKRVAQQEQMKKEKEERERKRREKAEEMLEQGKFGRGSSDEDTDELWATKNNSSNLKRQDIIIF